jgi:tetratricopeptide (TPR) repeat protein
MINKHLPTFILFFFSSFLFSQENFIYDFDLITQSVYELIENEEYEKALKEIDKIHFLAPNYLKSLGYKAEILGYMDKGDEKIDLLKKALEEGKFEEYPEFYTLLAQSYNSAERYTESILMEFLISQILPCYIFIVVFQIMEKDEYRLLLMMLNKQLN